LQTLPAAERTGAFDPLRSTDSAQACRSPAGERTYCFKSPLVETVKGDGRGGGARLTSLGEEALAHYRAMDVAAKQVASAYLSLFENLMAGGPIGKDGGPFEPPC
jgi:hypothetical protein